MIQPLLSIDQIKKWNNFTIENVPILSIDLMERAAGAFFTALCGHSAFSESASFVIFCGNGNNGGDGLAVSRMLRMFGCDVAIYIINVSRITSDDFKLNLNRLDQFDDVRIHYILSSEDFPSLDESQIVIDAILGTGTKGALLGLVDDLVQYLNNAPSYIYSIDVPSGMPANSILRGNAIKADHFITFQIPKLAFLYKEHEDFCSSWEVVDIGLMPEFLRTIKAENYLLTPASVAPLIRLRRKHDFKANFGHAALICGNEGMLGAAVLAGYACMKSGAGLTTLICESKIHSGLASTHPELLTSDISNITDRNWDEFNAKFSALGIGCGLGTSALSVQWVESVLKHYKGCTVLDADAINILSDHSELLGFLGANCVLTPHLGEFARLVGFWQDSDQMLAMQRNFSKHYKVYICLKGAFTSISDPSGRIFFNTTGNPGMASAGMGDVLTGLLTGILAQRYTIDHALYIGVLLHGLAGDVALQNESMESLIATDVIQNFGNAYKYLKRIV